MCGHCRPYVDKIGPPLQAHLCPCRLHITYHVFHWALARSEKHVIVWWGMLASDGEPPLHPSELLVSKKNLCRPKVFIGLVFVNLQNTENITTLLSDDFQIKCSDYNCISVQTLTRITIPQSALSFAANTSLTRMFDSSPGLWPKIQAM